MSRSLVNEWCEQAGVDAATLKEFFNELPPVDPSKPNGARNREIFGELVDGLSVSEVAVKHGLTQDTVRNAFRKGCRELSRKLHAQKMVERYFNVVDVETLAEDGGCSVELIKAALKDPKAFGIKFTDEERAMLDGRLSGLSAAGMQQQNECLRDSTVGNIERAAAVVLDYFINKLYDAQRFIEAWDAKSEEHTWEHAAKAYHVTVEELKKHASTFSRTTSRVTLFNEWCNGASGLEAGLSTGLSPSYWKSELDAAFSQMRSALNEDKVATSEGSGLKSMSLTNAWKAHR